MYVCSKMGVGPSDCEQLLTCRHGIRMTLCTGVSTINRKRACLSSFVIHKHRSRKRKGSATDYLKFCVS